MKKSVSFLKIFYQNFFGYTPPKCVGIDIGSSSIKMVELQPNSFIIVKYHIEHVKDKLISHGLINEIYEVAELIIRGWEHLRPRYDHAAIAIPYAAIITKNLSVPYFSSKYDLDHYVLDKLIQDLDTDEIDFDYNIIKKEEDSQKISVVVAKKETIEEYQAVIQMGGIKIAAIDVEPFAIQDLISKLLNRQKIVQQIILLDIGFSRLRLYVFQNTELVYFNEMTIDYPLLNQTLTTAKMDPIASYAPEDNLDNLNKIVFADNLIIKQIDELNNWINIISSDINKIIQSARSNILIEKKLILESDLDLYLMGGNALIPDLIDKLQVYGISQINLVSKLLLEENQHISEANILLLIPAIALATWGHRIDTN